MTEKKYLIKTSDHNEEHLKKLTTNNKSYWHLKYFL